MSGGIYIAFEVKERNHNGVIRRGNIQHDLIDRIIVEILGLLFLSLKQLQVDWKSKHFRHEIYSDHEAGDAAFSLTTWEGRTMIHRLITSTFLTLKNDIGYICDA